MNISNTIALISALAAIVMASLALIKAFGRERKVNKLVLDEMQERLNSKKKAILEACISYKEAQGILIYNNGECIARNINVQIKGSEDENGLFLLITPDIIPYPFLHKGGSFRIICAISEGSKPIVCIKLTWDDDYSLNREKEVILNLL